MKKILIENRIYIGIGLITLIFGTLLLWPSQNKTVEVPKETETKINGMMQKAEQIEWGNTQIIIPDKMATLKTTNNFISGEGIDKLMKAVGMVNAKVTKSDEFYVIYKDDNNAVLYVKLKERQIDYQIGRKINNEGKKSAIIAEANFKKIISEITSRKIGKITTEYFKDEFRSVRSTIDEADFMQIEANFVYKNIPILSFYGGASIKAQYNFKGELGRLIIFNPFDQIKEDAEVELLNIEEVKNREVAKLPIFDVKGNREYTMSTGEESLKTISSENSELVYVFEPKTNNYVPFLRVNGTAELVSGEVKTIFGVPIVKQ